MYITLIVDSVKYNSERTYMYSVRDDKLGNISIPNKNVLIPFRSMVLINAGAKVLDNPFFVFSSFKCHVGGRWVAKLVARLLAM